MTIPPLFKGEPHVFQKQGAGYLYFIRKALLADQTGLGKTIQMILLNCLQKQQGKLRGHIQVVPAQSLLQWYSEYRRFAPGLQVRPIYDMQKSERVSQYNCNFDVLLVSYHIVQRDWSYLAQTYYNSIGFDEASFFKSPDTKTFDFVTYLAKDRDYIIPASATPIQMCLVDLWSVFQVFNMPGLLGTRTYFMNRYCEFREEVSYAGGKKRTKNRITGYKNVNELIGRIAPFYIRRRVSDVEQELPDVISETKLLEMHPQQAELYHANRQDIINSRYRGTDLRNRFHLLKQTLDGLATLDAHNPDISIKSDTVMELLNTDLVGEKAIIFSMYKSTIYALEHRFRQAGVEYAVLSGDEKDQQVRFGIQERFRLDPRLQIIIGTTALEMSLNLQSARYLICYDLLYNPARMTQIIGRLRRLGSPHKTNVIINLICKDTIEETLLARLQQRQAVSDFVFGEQSDIFERLGDDELLTLIKG